MRHGRRASIVVPLLVCALAGAGCASGSPQPRGAATATPGAAVTRAPGPHEGCMPRPSACGYPDITNTGVTPGRPLAAVKGVVTLDRPGEVLENKQVTGAIVVTARDVIIRNVRLIITDPYYGISVKPDGDWNGAGANLLVDHVDIDMHGELGVKAIAFNGYTLRHAFLHDGADCAHFGADVTIEDSLCVLGPDANGNGWPDSTRFCGSPEHFDGFQTNGAEDAVIRHDTVRNPCAQTSAIALFGVVRNVIVADNLLTGGGYTLYCGSPNATDVRVTGNRFARTWHRRSGRFGRMTACDTGVTLTRNEWDATRRPAPAA
jgi:hypothetical protein